MFQFEFVFDKKVIPLVEVPVHEVKGNFGVNHCCTLNNYVNHTTTVEDQELKSF